MSDLTVPLRLVNATTGKTMPVLGEVVWVVRAASIGRGEGVVLELQDWPTASHDWSEVTTERVREGHDLTRRLTARLRVRRWRDLLSWRLIGLLLLFWVPVLTGYAAVLWVVAYLESWFFAISVFCGIPAWLALCVGLYAHESEDET